MPKMNPEVKAQWIAALRSGKYIQGRDVLRNSDNRFCCLGVLCDIHERTTGEGEWYLDPDRNCRYCYKTPGIYGSTTGLLRIVSDWSGVEPDVYYKGSIVGLADLNDIGRAGGPLSFNEIADIIEKQL